MIAVRWWERVLVCDRSRGFVCGSWVSRRQLNVPASPDTHVAELSYMMLQMSDSDRKPGRATDHRGLAMLAASQDGLFTAHQAEGFGVTRRLLSHHAKTGRYERLDHGLYLVPEIPGSPWREVVAAWLQAGADETVVSHQTALALHDLSDVIADSIHLTVPRSRRSRRHPPGATVHTQLAPFSPSEVQTRHFVRVTAPARTILDCLEAGVGLEQIAMAINQAIERGWISRSDLRVKAAKRGRRVARLIDDLLRAQEDST